LKMLKYPDGSLRILVQGLRRMEVTEYVQTSPFRARATMLTDVYVPGQDLSPAQAQVVSQFTKFISMVPYLPDELQSVIANIKDVGRLTDLVASNLNIQPEEKQELLDTLEVHKRVEKLGTTLTREIELLELGQKIQTQVQSELTKGQKEYYLRQQMRAI